MTGNYYKKSVCLTCRNKVLKDEYETSAHQSMNPDHKLESYTFGSYRLVEDRRQPLEVPQEKVKIDVTEEYEEEPQEEDNG